VIADNHIDLAGELLSTIRWGPRFSVGVPGAEVEVYVSRNKIKNTTEPAINFRRVDGRVYVERNMITTVPCLRRKRRDPSDSRRKTRVRI